MVFNGTFNNISVISWQVVHTKMYQVHLVMNGLELTIMGPKLQILHSSNWKTDTIYVFYLHVILIYVNVFPL